MGSLDRSHRPKSHLPFSRFLGHRLTTARAQPVPRGPPAAAGGGAAPAADGGPLRRAAPHRPRPSVPAAVLHVLHRVHLQRVQQRRPGRGGAAGLAPGSPPSSRQERFQPDPRNRPCMKHQPPGRGMDIRKTFSNFSTFFCASFSLSSLSPHQL